MFNLVQRFKSRVEIRLCTNANNFTGFLFWQFTGKRDCDWYILIRYQCCKKDTVAKLALTRVSLGSVLLYSCFFFCIINIKNLFKGLAKCAQDALIIHSVEGK